VIFCTVVFSVWFESQKLLFGRTFVQKRMKATYKNKEGFSPFEIGVIVG
jgi:hypothetical protein